MRGKCTQLTRRTVIRSLTGGLFVTEGISAGSSRQETGSETIIVPATSEYESEVILLSKLPGVTVSHLENNYVIEINRSRLESAGPEERRTAKTEVRESVDEMTVAVAGKVAVPTETTTNSRTLPTTEEPPRMALGERKLFREMNVGELDSRSSGQLITVGGADYNRVENRLTASVLTAMGVGNRSEISRLGTEFVVEGEASRSAKVITTGEYKGLLTAVGSASSEISVTLNVVNTDTAAKETIEIASELGSTKDWKNRSGRFRRGMQTLFRPGDKYRIYVELEAYVDCYGVGEAGADFGPQDYDVADPPHGLELDSIEVLF